MIEKHTPISRALIAASQMPAHQARRVLMLICESGMTMREDVPQSVDPTEGEKHYAKREKFIRRMKSSTDRVLDYARHETLRKIEKHFRETSAIHSAESGAAPTEPSTSLAARLTFDKETLATELLAALREDQESALAVAGQQLFDEIGRDSVWKLPSQDAIQFVQDRANLLANVPDEIHTGIMQSIEQGLQQGESRKELMARISTAFDEIGRSRAETIANTETAAAFNYSRDKAMREAGVTHKRWLHSMSPLIKEPRPAHLEADGQTVPIDEPFDVGGVLFMHPGDDSLGAGPESIINCFCISIPVESPIKSEAAGHPFRGNQYVAGETSVEPTGVKTDFEQRARLDEIKRRGNQTANRLGFPTNKIDYLESGDPVKFNVGDKQFVRGGFYSPSNGRITIDSTAIHDPVHIDSLMAHEISHAQYDAVKQAHEAEHAEISKLIQNDETFNMHFSAGGFLKPESKVAFARKFPVSTAFSRTWGDSYLEGAAHTKTAEMIEDDGISDYSKAYWAKSAVEKYQGRDRAIDETLAEIYSWDATGAKHLSRPSEDWAQFSRDIRIQYKRIKSPYVEISKWEK